MGKFTKKKGKEKKTRLFTIQGSVDERIKREAGKIMGNEAAKRRGSETPASFGGRVFLVRSKSVTAADFAS